MVKNKKLFLVTYRDNKNVTHFTFVKGFKSLNNLENQYGKHLTVQTLKAGSPVICKM